MDGVRAYSLPLGAGLGHVWPVLVVGAGPAGCAVALALRLAGVDVLVLDRLSADETRSPSSARIESATPDVPGLLADLCAATPPGLSAWRGTMSAWGGDWQWRSFSGQGHGDGWLLDRALFDAHLRQCVQVAGAKLCQGWTLAGVQRTQGAWVVEARPTRAAAGLAAPISLRAAVLVDATGRRAALATGWLGVNQWRCDQQVALQALLPAPPEGEVGVPDDRVWVEAVPEGWWCALRSPAGQTSVSLMTDADLVTASTQVASSHHPVDWQASLRRTRWWCEVMNPAAARPPLFSRRAAHSACLAQAVGPGWVAVGDALLSLDPMSSSGLSGAFRDGRDVVQQLLLPWLSGAAALEPARAWSARAETSWQRFLRGARAHHQTMPANAGAWWQRRQQAWPARWPSRSLAAVAAGQVRGRSHYVVLSGSENTEFGAIGG